MQTSKAGAWLAVGIVVALVGGVVLARTTQKPLEESPHATALRLVFDTQMSQIRDVEKEDWWLDTKERTWAVQRLFAPGYFDSTHWFNVTYRIDGKEAASWLVDTARGQVQRTTNSK